LQYPCICDDAPVFIPVEDIIVSPLTVEQGKTYTLTATVIPHNATNQKVEIASFGGGQSETVLNWDTWEFRADGDPPQTISGLVYVDNGLAQGVSFNKHFTIDLIAPIPVFVPVTNITLTSPSTVMETETLQFTGTVNPSNTTNQTIQWSMADCGLTYSFFDSAIPGLLWTNSASTGTATVRATVVNGTASGVNYTQDFPIQVTAWAPPGPTLVPCNCKWTFWAYFDSGIPVNIWDAGGHHFNFHNNTAFTAISPIWNWNIEGAFMGIGMMLQPSKNHFRNRRAGLSFQKKRSTG
jgi:hypothetical protein